jgi:Tfp pilus assembly protein PilV
VIRVVDRLRRDEGFGLIELLLAMLILNIGILAIVASFQSGAVAIKRASRISNATTLAASQMELYRALKYESIALHTTTANTLTSTNNEYSCDSALKTNQSLACGSSNRVALVTGSTCSGSPLPNECNPSREQTGPDRVRYRIDTYIIAETPANGRALKRVTIVVRDLANLTRTWARKTSTFDASTG